MDEIDNAIAKCIKNIESVDFLIGSPIEPFCQEGIFSGIYSPGFEFVCRKYEDLEDFLHCAEVCNFHIASWSKIPVYDEAAKEDCLQYAMFKRVENDTTIYFQLFVTNSALEEQAIDEMMKRVCC